MSRQLRTFLKYPDKLFRRVRDEHGNLRLSKSAAAFHPSRGVYRSSYKNARRLAATESNIAYRMSDYLRWQDLDFVVGIEIHLSNNHTLNGKPFKDICDQLKGRYPKTFKWTGWHPLCRCYATTVQKTDAEFMEDNRRILRGKEPLTDSKNAVKDMPENFNKWVKENQERIESAKSLPYFIRDNKSVVDNILNSDVQLIDIKDSLIKIKDPKHITNKEIETILMDFFNANQSIFNGHLAGIEINNKRAPAFMSNRRYYRYSDDEYNKERGNTLSITNGNFGLEQGVVYNPLYELKGAISAIIENTPLTFHQEYTLESVWHEFRHAAAVGWKKSQNVTEMLTMSMEVINQFCARQSYPSFIKSLGGSASHTSEVIEKGYGYGRAVSNFNTLLKHMGVSPSTAHKHFKDVIINEPYENIHEEIVRFVEAKGKYSKEEAQKIVEGLCETNDEFQGLL